MFRIFQSKMKHSYVNIEESASDIERNEVEKQDEGGIEFKSKLDQYKRKP